MLRTAVLSVVLLSSACHAPHPSQQSNEDERTRKFWNDEWTGDIKSGALQKSYNGSPSEGRDAWAPNAFLSRVLDGKSPGTALDVHMGEGRNALAMARRGWTVTGFDISDVAINLARGNASREGLSLNAVRASDRDFEYGSERYDLIAGIYAHGWPNSRTDDVIQSLRPGGLVVVEAFLKNVPWTETPLPSSIDAVGYRINELLHTFGKLTILHYEDGVGKPDGIWSPQNFRFVRLVARKD
jgi:SAM-dependent methyltransferase